MVAYADTGFIVSLYFSEPTSPRAHAAAGQLREALPITPFLLLELRNAFNLGIKRGEVDAPERNALWRKFETDLSDGIFVYAPLSLTEGFRLARDLSDRHTPHFGTRSLDLLHLASARILGASELLTFDQKQAKAARAEGLKVRP
jgi:predicted nucleic acid-binding protein